ncbi:MAG: glycoside hydrolase family 44 protein [Oligoflexus sp.]
MKFITFLSLLGLAFPLHSALAKTWKLELELKKSANLHRQISPYIYGFGTYFHEDRSKEEVWQLYPSAYRFGGNTSERFNYQVNAWNTGNDWFFRNIEAPVANVVDQFMQENRQNKAASAITLPLLGWVAKDTKSYSFPRKRFPKQQGFERNAGNGVNPQGKAISTDPNLTSIAIDPDFLAGWVKKLKNQFGPHPHIYILGNEPMLWHQTHRDVRYYKPVTYDEYLKKYLAAAKIVRKTDPSAVIVGPALWGWLAWQRSGYDTEGPWNDWQAMQDRKKHGDQAFLEWFLLEVVKEEKKFGSSLIDWVDVHYYPESDRWPKGKDHESKIRKQLLAATRSLWDRRYKDNSWIDQELYFIPRLKELAAKVKPGLKVAIGEYNFRSEYDVSGAVVQAETLGIFAKTDLDAAFYWDFPRKDGTHRFAFQLYRNYDDKGAAFGDRWVANNIEIDDEISVFSSRHSQKKRITIVTINKSLDKQQSIQLSTKNIGQIKSIRHFDFHSPKLDDKMQRTKRDLKNKESVLSWEIEPLSLSVTELNY